MTIAKTFGGAAVPTTVTGSMTALAPGAAGTFVVASATGYPSSGAFVVVISRGLADEEKILCSSRAGTTFTVGSRGYDGTTAQIHSAGATCEHELDAATMTSLVTHVDNTAVDDHTQYLNVARHDIEARHQFGSGLAFGIPVAPAAVSTAASSGVGDNPAKEDHVHALSSALSNVAPATVDTSTAALAAGAAGTLARSDHVHTLTNGVLPYTPVLTATGSNPTITYTAQSGFYFQIGKQVWASFYLIVNVVTGEGTGNYRISLPVTMDSALVATFTAGFGMVLGSGAIKGSGAGNAHAALITVATNATVEMYIAEVSPLAKFSATNPADALATSALIQGSIMYPAA